MSIRKCPNCGGKASQCRCPQEAVEIQRVMNHAVRRGRLEVVQNEPLPEEREMIAFEERLKDAFAKRCE